MKPEEITKLGWYIETAPDKSYNYILITKIRKERLYMYDLGEDKQLSSVENSYGISVSLRNYTYEYIYPPSTLEEFKDNYPELFL